MKRKKLLKDIKAFASDWSEHHNRYKELYKSKKYHDALIASKYKRPAVYATFGKQKIDITEMIYENSTMSFISGLPTKTPKEFKSILKKADVETVDDYISLVEDAFKNPDNYKEYIELLLKMLCNSLKITVNLKSLPKGTDLSAMTKEEILNALRKVPRPSEPEAFSSYKSNTINSFVNRFENYEISKSTYFDWKNPAKEQRDFDKKFFVSLGFMLGLPINEFEALLTYNGYCLAGSKREFDKIILEAVVCGYPFEYVQEIIRGANDELYNKYGSDISKIPNLKQNVPTKNSK